MMRVPMPSVARPPVRALAAFALSTALAIGVAGTGASPAAAAARPSTRDATPAQVIVRLDPATLDVARLNAQFGTALLASSSGVAGTYLLSAPGDDPEALAAQIATVPGVVWATANGRLTPPEVDQTRMYAWRMYAWTEGAPLPTGSSYALDAIDAAGAQAIATGAGAVVAIVDTGVSRHAALRAALVPGVDLVDGDTDPSETANGLDDDGDGVIDEGVGHGTHVAGVVHQVAPAARIMPVRVLDDDGSGSMWTTAEGILWAARSGARVVNASLGTHGSAELLKDVVDVVTRSGTLVVGAAGNDGKDRPMYPAAARGALAVASVGAGDVVSSFSNVGRWIAVSAPGENVFSTYPFPDGAYATTSGTSMATPFVAGEAALVLSKRPSLTPAQVASLIKATADAIDAHNPAVAGLIGSGRINARAAVAAA